MRLLLALLVALPFSALAQTPAPAPAQTGGGLNLSVKPDASSVTYHIVHKLHRVDGTSKKVEGRARVQSAGPTQVAIRIPVESFDSANVNRDAHMKESVEAARYPTVELKAVTDGIAVPERFPATYNKQWKAQLSFHGVTHDLEIPVTVRFDAADKVVATTSFSISLDQYKVERPSLMFVKIDDAMKIEATLTFGP
jgi:polyisoprenoid-binding protein YceI